MLLFSIIKDFSQWTSSHGIPLIGAARNVFLRVVWITVFLGCLAMFSYQLYDIFRTYLKYEVSVALTVILLIESSFRKKLQWLFFQLKFEGRDFPVITVCGVNPYKTHAAIAYPKIKHLVQNYSVKMEDPSLETAAEWNFSVKKNCIENMALKVLKTFTLNFKTF